MIKIATFDIFDTCLVRATGGPDSVFILMARRILNTSSKSDIQDFVIIRKEGEKKARNMFNREISLAELYSQCDFSGLTDWKNEDIMRVELEVEKNVLTPVMEIKSKIIKLREKGIKIGYISDMYLPANFIKSVLEENGLYKENDLLYVSSESKNTKSDGALYRYFKDQQSITHFGNWVHYGDNWHSDWINALKAGALVKHVKHQYNDNETLDEKRTLPYLKKDIEIIHSVCKSLRICFSKDQRYSFAVDVIAPIYVPFVWNVLSQACSRGIKDLYFFARDGLIFYQIARIFSPSFNDISLHYIYVSRKSIYFPTVDCFDKENIKSLFPKDETSYNRIMADLCMKEDDFDSSQWDDIIRLNGRDEIVDYVFSHHQIEFILKQKYEEQRSLFLKYLEKEGLARINDKSALVDLRGTRKSHERINTFLRKNGYKEVYGYYFEVIEDRVPPSNGDMYYSEIYREDFVGTSFYEALQNSTALFEQYFSITPHNRTSHYYQNSQGEICPVFDKEEIPSYRREYYDKNVKACVDFAKMYQKYVSVEHSNIFSQYFLTSFLMLMKHPKHRFLKLLDGLRVSENEFTNSFFVKKLTPYNVLNYRIIWKKGSAAYTYGIWLWNIHSIINNLKRWIISR